MKSTSGVLVTVKAALNALLTENWLFLKHFYLTQKTIKRHRNMKLNKILLISFTLHRINC